MPIHDTAGVKVTVAFDDTNFLVARRQGVSIAVNKQRRWWCLWLCSTTDKVRRISIEATLSGVAGNEGISSTCTDCGSVSAWGRWFFGVFVGRAFDRVDYSGTVMINNNTGMFSGSDIP